MIITLVTTESSSFNFPNVISSDLVAIFLVSAISIDSGVSSDQPVQCYNHQSITSE